MAFVILSELDKGIEQMKSLRISIVAISQHSAAGAGVYTWPLRGKYEFSFTVPSQCAEALRSRQVDIAIIPAIEYQRIDGLVILPDLSIASKKSVRSLLLVSKKPIQEVRTHRAGSQFAQHAGAGANSVRQALAHRAGIF